jgi:glucose dehydrogenase
MGKFGALLLTVGLLAGKAGAAEDHDWPAYGGGDGTHYSSLSQINRDNVKDLVVAWKYDTGEQGGIEASPIIIGKVMYATTPRNTILALDAASGKLIWKYTFDVR